MREIIAALVLSATSVPTLLAQGTWEWLHPWPHGQAVRWLKMWDARTWYMVTGGGAFVKTTDGGTSWSFTAKAGYPQAGSVTSGPNELLGAWFFDRDNGIAGGQGGGVMITTNAGATWDSVRLLATTSRIYNFHFVDRRIGYLCGGSAICVWKTTDGGRVWRPLPGLPPVPIYDVYAPDTNHIVAASNAGTVYVTSDAGANWTAVPTSGSPAIYDMDFVSPTEGYAAGGGGRYMYTTNGGRLWTVMPMPHTRTMRRIRHVGGTSHLVGTYDFDAPEATSAVYVTTDRGETWDSLRYLAPGQLFGPNTCEGFDRVGNTMVVGGFNGFTNSSTDAGRSWQAHTQLAADGGVTAAAVLPLSRNGHIWAGGALGLMIHSADGGKSWEQQNTGTRSSILAMASAGSTVYFTTANGWIGRSTDSGATWDSTAYPAVAHQVTSIDMVSSTTGWAGGGVPSPFNLRSIAKTTDGGTTWTLQTSANTPPVAAIDMLDARNGWYVSVDGAGGRTSDGGETWTGFALAGTVAPSTLKAFDMNVAYVGGGEGGKGFVARTTDGGATWNFLAQPFYPFPNTWFAMDWSDRNRGIVAGASGYVGITSNGGASWQMEFAGGGVSTRDLRMAGPDTAFMVCGGGGSSANTFCQVWRWTRGGTTAATEWSPAVPALYTLEQNYPNPFNPGTTIRFALPEPGVVSLKVYDVTGALVAAPLSGMPLNAGTVSHAFDASGLPSGVYFYALDVDGRRVEAKKMLLLR